MRKVFFLNPPSYAGFDGGAGSRYQAKREIRSFWYPVWLAQAAALCPGSRVLDAPAEGLSEEGALMMADGFDLAVIFTSTPGFRKDADLVRRFRQKYPDMLIGMVGPHVTALPGESLGSVRDLDFVARGEFDYTVMEIAEGNPFSHVEGISYREDDRAVHNGTRTPIRDMDALPSVLDVYKRDLKIQNYFVGYLLDPYLAVYSGRGCDSRCTFCLWPQTIGGHKYRTRSVENVVAEIARAKEMFPEVKEFFFDDDSFTAKPDRAEEIARGLKPLQIAWSCSTRANVSEETLRVMKMGGLRLMMVGIESGSDRILKNIRKGITADQCRRFMKMCRQLGIMTHATFVIGLPGETKETIRQTIEFARELDPDTLQVSIATPYPGTEFYRQALENGWLIRAALVNGEGLQQVSHEYQNLSRADIFEAVQTFYSRYYFRPKPILRIVKSMLGDRAVCKRRLREGWEFFRFMHDRKNG